MRSDLLFPLIGSRHKNGDSFSSAPVPVGVERVAFFLCAGMSLTVSILSAFSVMIKILFYNRFRCETDCDFKFTYIETRRKNSHLIFVANTTILCSCFIDLAILEEREE
jgi:hypothetical protein